MLLVLSVLQDVLLCRFHIFGATTELVPCGIFLICILEGTERSCIFALVASLFYLFSGSSAGIYSIVLVLFGWTLFFFEDMKALGAFFVRLFTPAATGAEGLNLVLGFLPLMLVAILASTPAAKALFARHEDKAIVRWGRIVVSAVLLLLCVAALASNSYNPFKIANME